MRSAPWAVWFACLCAAVSVDVHAQALPSSDLDIAQHVDDTDANDATGDDAKADVSDTDEADDAARRRRRIALLVGNSDYGAAPLDLNSPPHDLVAMREAMGHTDFDDVVVVENADRAALIEALQEARRKSEGGTVLFYFSGHAISVDGTNWLLPVGTELKHVDDVPLAAVSVPQVLRLLRNAHLRVLVLDACRTNPFGLGAKAFGTGGLSRDSLRDYRGTFISYAASNGSIAYDGKPGEASPFTRALVRNLTTPGLDLPNLFMNVRGDLAAATHDAPRGPQRSEEISSLTHDHRFQFVESVDVGGAKGTFSTRSPVANQPVATVAAAAPAAATAAPAPTTATQPSAETVVVLPPWLATASMTSTVLSGAVAAAGALSAMGGGFMLLDANAKAAAASSEAFATPAAEQQAHNDAYAARKAYEGIGDDLLMWGAGTAVLGAALASASLATWWVSQAPLDEGAAAEPSDVSPALAQPRAAVAPPAEPQVVFDTPAPETAPDEL